MLETLENIPTFLLIGLSVLCVAMGDYFGKKWSIDHRTIFFFLACLASLFSGIFYFPVLLKNGLVVTSLIWTILSIVAFLVIGFAIFHESVSVLQIVGIIIGIVSVVLLSI